MVAQSHCPHLDLEVRIAHLLEEAPPKRRTQKRLARTNEEGLVALVPFINFTPGLWQICCSCETSSGSSEDSWQETVQIRVESKENPIIDPEVENSPAPPTEQPESSSSELAKETDSVPEPFEVASEVADRAVELESSTAPQAEEALPLPPAEISPSPDELSPPSDSSPDEEVATPDREDINSLLDRSIENLEQILQQASQPRNEEVDEPEPPPPPSLPPSIPEEIANLQLRLTLYHDNFVRHQDESILISGQIDAIAPPWEDFATLFAPVEGMDVQLLLRYHLRDPQSSAFYDSASGGETTPTQPIFDSRQPTIDAALPLIFGYNLQVPPEYRAPLILGEAVLELSLHPHGGSQRSVAILARQPFAISAALSELLEVAFPSEAPPKVGAEQQEPSEEIAPINADFVEIARNASEAYQFQPTSQQILPPKLSSGGTNQAPKFVQLPEFPASQPTEEDGDSAEMEGSKGVEEALEVSETEDIVPSDEVERVESDGIEEALEASEIPLGDRPLESEIVPPVFETDEVIASEPAEPSELDTAFQSLRLEERFWSRMNSLAEDAPSFAAENLLEEAAPTPDLEEQSEEESEIDTAEAEPPEVEATDAPEPLEEDSPQESVLVNPAPEVELPLGNLPLSPSNLPFLGEVPETESEVVEEAIAPEVEAEVQPDPEDDWIDQEIVVEDDEDLLAPSPLKHDASGLPYPADVKVSARKPMGEVERNLETPIPAPLLEVSEGELIAGEPVMVRVKLPPHPGAIYVKLWVQDCQTRHLLDGPRAFVDFTPNQSGELETITQLLVPPGSLEIRLEAIAIDIESQRESHKAIVERRAIPPDLTNSPRDEF